jgi:hypothetical protein
LKRDFLRLVPQSSDMDRKAVAGGRAFESRVMTPAGHQLTLPFTGEAADRIFFIVAMDHIHGAHFCEYITRLKPKMAVDLRHLIRFDLPGTSRQDIFNRLNATKTEYIREPLPWHQLGPKNFISDDTQLSHGLYHELIERNDTPVMFLTSKQNDAIYLFTYINRMLATKISYSWKIEHIA